MVNNIGPRKHQNSLKAGLGANAGLTNVEKGDYYSCYQTDAAKVAENGNVFVLTQRLSSPAEVFAVLVALDQSFDAPESDKLLWGFRVYIGSSPNYWENQECAGGPYLNKPSDDPSWGGQWPFGKEIFCNIYG